MALRVKYRVRKERGLASVPVSSCGLHSGNRGGMYPQPDRCMTLGKALLRLGFLMEEATHAAVAAQEIPFSKRPDGYISFTDYNKAATKGRPVLATCLEHVLELLYGLWAHNHFMTVLLCWLTGAPWDLRDKDDKPLYCKTLKLDLSAVADLSNVSEMLELLRIGFTVDVLSYTMTLDEPHAAGLISSALNLSQEVSLRSTELEAIAALTGEVTLLMERKTSQAIAFETVQAAVAAKLSLIADEPRCVELVDFVISLDAGRTPTLLA